MTRTSRRKLPRPFKLHWGKGMITEEAACLGEFHEPTLQLLEFDEGYHCLRFCYYKKGRFQRSPLMLSDKEIAKLRVSIGKSPRIKKLLKRLISN